MNCLLCSHPAEDFLGVAYKCPRCFLVFKNPAQHLETEAENERYGLHQNNVEDPGYKKFLNKLLIPLSDFLPEHFTALDFGCGPGPLVSMLLEEKGGTTFNYDPLFKAENSLLNSQYDVVTSTEVVEHFKNPDRDWKTLTALVKPGGLLAIMTQFLKEETDYLNWWYKNDPTHVVFYNQKTFSYLEETFGLERLFDDNLSVIIFRKKL